MSTGIIKAPNNKKGREIILNAIVDTIREIEIKQHKEDIKKLYRECPNAKWVKDKIELFNIK